MMMMLMMFNYCTSLKVHHYSLYHDIDKEDNYIPGDNLIYLLELETDVILSGKNREAALVRTTFHSNFNICWPIVTDIFFENYL